MRLEKAGRAPVNDEQLDKDFAKFWDELSPTLRNALGRLGARHIYGSGWYDGGVEAARILMAANRDVARVATQYISHEEQTTGELLNDEPEFAGENALDPKKRYRVRYSFRGREFLGEWETTHNDEGRES